MSGENLFMRQDKSAVFPWQSDVGDEAPVQDDRKLSNEDAVKLFKLYWDEDRSERELAHRFGIGRATVVRIAHRLRYRDATEGIEVENVV